MYNKFFIVQLILCCSLLSNSVPIVAQKYINGIVLKENGESLYNYHILLLNKSDSSLIIAKSFDTDSFSIEKPNSASIIRISYIGYKDTTISIIEENKTVDLGEIILRPMSYFLEEIAVEAKTPFMMKKDDKLIFNIENSSISNIGNAIDVLQKTPYIISDQNGTITIAGRNKTLILINGKPVRNSDELQSLNSSRIKEIAVIENPSAKYEAEGDAVIEIITKRKTKEGLNGSVFLSYRQGKRASNYFSPEISYETKKIRFRVNLGGNISERSGNNQTWTQYEKPNYLFSSYTYDLKRVNKDKSVTYNIDLDYLINKQSNISIAFDGNIARKKSDALSNIEIRKNDTRYPILAMDMKDQSKTNQNSISVIYNLKTNNGITLFFLNNYTKYQINTETSIIETDKSYNNRMKGSFDNNYDLIISQADVIFPISYINGKIETGGKYSYVNSRNDLDFRRKVLDNWSVIPSFSGKVHFSEQILAGYLSIYGKTGKWKYSFGARLENNHTINRSGRIKNGAYKDEHLHLFPNFSLSFSPHQKLGLDLRYSHRISRPSYSSLNNNVLYIDSLSTRQGNPFLISTIYRTLSLSALWNRKLTVTASYSNIKNPIDLLFINHKDNIEKYTVIYHNVKDTWSVSLNSSMNLRYKAWFVQPSLSLSYSPVTIIDDDIEYTFKHPMYMMRCINQIDLPKNWNIDINVMYQQPAYSFKTFGEQFDVDIGVSKKMINKKLILAANIHNSFMPWIQKYQYSYKYNKVVWNGNNRHYFNLSIRYNFGIKTNNIKNRKDKSEELMRM